MLGENSDLHVRSDRWVYQEGFVRVQDAIELSGGLDSNGQTTGGANDRGSSVFVSTTSQINSFQSGSEIRIEGAQDVDLYGAVVAGGEIGPAGVTWAGPGSTVSVVAGQQVYLDTGLLASETVKVYTTDQNALWVDTATVSIDTAEGGVEIYDLVNATESIRIAGTDVGVLGDAVVKTRGADSQIYLQADQSLFVQRDPGGVAGRAVVEAADRVHLYGGDVRIDGTVQAGDNTGDVVVHAIGDLLVTGLITALRDVELHAGVPAGMTEAQSAAATFSSADLAGDASITVRQQGRVEAGGHLTLNAATDLTVDAYATVGDGQVTLPDPNIVQQPQTVRVVTGSRQVEDGFITVPEVQWVDTTVTEQVGVEEVKVGVWWNTMSVTLTQDAFYNGTTEREYFVENVDYFNEAGRGAKSVPWSSHGVSAPANDKQFHEINDAQRDTVLSHFGYKPLYDFGYDDFQKHGTVDGIPFSESVIPTWDGNDLAIYSFDVATWDDKYIRMPEGAQNDVLRVVTQGEPSQGQETVARWQDTARLKYTQDKSSHTANSGTSTWYAWNHYDWDNSTARWRIDYHDDGQRRVEVYDGRTGSGAVAFDWTGVLEPAWLDNDVNGNNVQTKDKLNRSVYAPVGFTSDTSRIYSRTTHEIREDVQVGSHWREYPRNYYVSPTKTSFYGAYNVAQDYADAWGWDTNSYLARITSDTENAKVGGLGAQRS